MTRTAADLVLAPRLAPHEVEEILRPFGFRNPPRADSEIQSLVVDPLAREPLALILGDLLGAVSRDADPDAALGRLERMVRTSGAPALLFSHLREAPPALEALCTVLGGGSFLSEVLIRHPEWLRWLSSPEVLQRRRPLGEVTEDLARTLAAVHSVERRRDLMRIARRRELLLIGVRDLLRLAPVDETLSALSDVAEALIDAALESEDQALRAECRLPAREGAVTGFTVLGLGKLGGGELNYSSDVDLVYLYDRAGGRLTRGSGAPERARYFETLAQRVTGALADTTAEGYVYRVDLRLRPEGRAGAVALPLAAFERYYRLRGRTWERLALLKAWPVAGDRGLGVRFRARVRSFIYGTRLSLSALEEVRGIKSEIDRKIAVRGETNRHVKLGLGGIREIEFVTQALQIRYGNRRPAIRQRGTLSALHALRAAGRLPREEHDVLVGAYLFLRDVENKLQIASDAQIHVLPESPGELRACALRLGFLDQPPGRAAQDLLSAYRTHTSAVRSIFEATIHGDRLGQ
jgi:glutamate-ammonia-ligase adenylyltransferase